MALDREPIATAIVGRLQAACPALKLITRSPVEFGEAPASQFPAALVFLGDEKAHRQRGAPPLWTITAHVMVATKNAPAPAAPDTQLNALELQVEGAFERQPNEATADRWQTSLGGLVSRCWVVEATRRQGQDEGDLVMTLEILQVGP